MQPRGFFDSRGEQLSLKTGAIYDLVLTAPVVVPRAALEGVNHSSCISKKCRGASRTEARTMAHGLGVDAVREHLLNDPDLLVLMHRFPMLRGEDVMLPSIKECPLSDTE